MEEPGTGAGTASARQSSGSASVDARASMRAGCGGGGGGAAGPIAASAIAKIRRQQPIIYTARRSQRRDAVLRMILLRSVCSVSARARARGAGSADQNAGSEIESRGACQPRCALDDRLLAGRRSPPASCSHQLRTRRTHAGAHRARSNPLLTGPCAGGGYQCAGSGCDRFCAQSDGRTAERQHSEQDAQAVLEPGHPNKRAHAKRQAQVPGPGARDEITGWCEAGMM